MNWILKFVSEILLTLFVCLKEAPIHRVIPIQAIACANKCHNSPRDSRSSIWLRFNLVGSSPLNTYRAKILASIDQVGCKAGLSVANEALSEAEPVRQERHCNLVVFKARTFWWVIRFKPVWCHKEAGNRPEVFQGLHKAGQDIGQEEVLEFY